MLRLIKPILLAVFVGFLSGGGYMLALSGHVDRRIDGLNQQWASLDRFEKTLNQQKEKGVGISSESYIEIENRRLAITEQRAQVVDEYRLWGIGIGALTFVVMCILGFVVNRRQDERKLKLSELMRPVKN